MPGSVKAPLKPRQFYVPQILVPAQRLLLTAADAPTTSEVATQVVTHALARTASDALNATDVGGFPMTNLVSYWKLDETSGTRFDSFGSSNLTEENAPIGSAVGRIGNAVNLVAASQQALTNPSVTVTGACSVSLWFQATSFPADYTNTFSLRAVLGSTQYLELYVNPSSKVAVYLVGSGMVSGEVFDGLGPTVFTAGQWYHYAVAHNDVTGLDIYINGVLEGHIASAGVLGGISAPLALGREMYTLQRWHNGLIDEVGLWQQGLIAADITNLYNGGAGIPLGAIGAVRSVQFVRTATDALTTAESVNRSPLLPLRTTAEAPTTAESAAASKSGAKTAIATDALTTTEIAVRAFNPLRTLVDAPTTAEAAGKTTAYPRAATDALTTSEIASKSATHPRTTTDTLTTAEATSKVAAHPRTTADAPVTFESAVASKLIVRVTTDAPATTESASGTRSVASIARTTTESLTTAESVIAVRAAAGALNLIQRDSGTWIVQPAQDLPFYVYVTATDATAIAVRTRRSTDGLSTAESATAMSTHGATYSVTATEALATAETTAASRPKFTTAGESLTAALIAARTFKGLRQVVSIH